MLWIRINQLYCSASTFYYNASNAGALDAPWPESAYLAGP